MTKFVILFLLIACAARAEGLPHGSLFFTPQQADAADNLAEKSMPPGIGDIRLGAILYYGPGDWAVWIRGEKWGPGTARDDLRITEVTPDKVYLAWHDEDNDVTRNIALRPSESYQIATGRIIPTP
ncbi:MAG: hypothetical protein P4M15_13255 [Alphaproteobacteria bacterium]|nr:hypothetical protein [Alphaproteobacteria bacterium]